MTPPAPVTRRTLLKGGLALGATAGLTRTTSGCAYIRDDVPAAAPLPKSAKAEIDGDLIYFNWADYLDPKVVKGFQREYGVKVIESNFDSMEGMYAKIAAGPDLPLQDARAMVALTVGRLVGHAGPLPHLAAALEGASA